MVFSRIWFITGCTLEINHYQYICNKGYSESSTFVFCPATSLQSARHKCMCLALVNCFTILLYWILLSAMWGNAIQLNVFCDIPVQSRFVPINLTVLLWLPINVYLILSYVPLMFGMNQISGMKSKMHQVMHVGFLCLSQDQGCDVWALHHFPEVHASKRVNVFRWRYMPSAQKVDKFSIPGKTHFNTLLLPYSTLIDFWDDLFIYFFY